MLAQWIIRQRRSVAVTKNTRAVVTTGGPTRRPDWQLTEDPRAGRSRDEEAPQVRRQDDPRRGAGRW